MSSVTVKLEPAKSYEIKIRGVNHGKAKGPWSDALAVTATTDAEERVLNAYTGYGMGIKLGDAAGATKFSIKDSASAEVAYINSDGEALVTQLTDSALTITRVPYASTSGLLVDNAGFTFDGTTVKVPQLTDSGLTITRIPYASTAGLLADNAGLTFDGTYLVANSIKDSALTSGRVPYAGASGLLLDSANLTFDGTALILAGGGASLAGNVTFTGAARTISAAAGYDLNLKMGDTIGANSIIFQNSTPATVAQLTSYGSLSLGEANACTDRRLNVRHSPTATGVTYGVHVYSYPVPSDVNASHYANYTLMQNSSARTMNYHILWMGELKHAGTNTLSYGYGGNVTVAMRSSGNMTYGFGYRATITAGASSSGTLGAAYGFHAGLGCDGGTGNITNAYGYFVRQLTGGSGTITNLYGLYIDSTVAGAATLNYAIYNASTSPIYSAGDVLLASGKVLKINAIQVVGAQGAAVADAAEDLTEVTTQLNDLLAKLRTHGLIASA